MTITEIFAEAPTGIGFLEKVQPFTDSHGDNIVAWRQACPSGAWLLWVAGISGVAPECLVAAACNCARQGFIYLPRAEDRPEAAIKGVEKWVRHEATAEECKRISDEVYRVQSEIGRQTCSEDISTPAAMLAAGAAAMPANAAFFSDDKRWCAQFCAQTVQMASGAARHADGENAMWRMHNLCADIVRDSLPDFSIPEE